MTEVTDITHHSTYSLGDALKGPGFAIPEYPVDTFATGSLWSTFRQEENVYRSTHSMINPQISQVYNVCGARNKCIRGLSAPDAEACLEGRKEQVQKARQEAARLADKQSFAAFKLKTKNTHVPVGADYA
jgi:hypothetical protein